MDTYDFDVVVIGAGIAGATASAAIALDHRVALLETEDVAGYHSTSRSAALWILNYGPSDVRVLSGLSRAFFEHPPVGFTDVPLISRRSVVFLAPEAQRAGFAALLAQGEGLREISVADVRARVPALYPGYATAAAIEEDAFDIDVAALHQGFLKQLRARGGILALRHRAGRIARERGRWRVETGANAVFSAPVVVNAAGAWGDDVAMIAHVRPIGLTPCRRTGVIVNPAPYNVSGWPLLNDVGHTWYARPEARTRLMLSPADETPMHPQDVQPDELDVAIAIHRMQEALDIPVQRVERSWAGLRTFTPDRSLALGWDRDATGFFWSVGQGGYGIQTSPAAGRLVADLIAGRDPGGSAAIAAAVDPVRFHSAG